LKAYEAVGRHGSLVAASRALNVTTGAVSRHIKYLQAELGVELLTRSGRGVRLTRAGQQLQEELEVAFAEIDGCVERILDQRSGDQLTVSCSPMFASAWLIPRIDRFESCGTRTEIVIQDKWSCPDRIPRNTDLIVDYGRFNDYSGCEVEKLSDEEIFPVCSPDLGRHIAETGGLAGCNLLHRKGIPPTAHWPGWEGFAACVGLDGIDANGGLHVSTALIMEAARGGKGVLLTNTTVAHDDLGTGRLVRPIRESMSNDCGYWLLAPHTRPVSSDVAAFRAWLKDEIALCSDGPCQHS
jgi:LysR family glycine cleavage system transcriptional activator